MATERLARFFGLRIPTRRDLPAPRARPAVSRAVVERRPEPAQPSLEAELARLDGLDEDGRRAA